MLRGRSLPHGGRLNGFFLLFGGCSVSGARAGAAPEWLRPSGWRGFAPPFALCANAAPARAPLTRRVPLSRESKSMGEKQN